MLTALPPTPPSPHSHPHIPTPTHQHPHTDADYIIMPTTMELSASQNRSCAVVDIVRDGLLEYNETFSIALRTTADNVVVDGTRNVTRIIIVDSDRK